MVLTWKATLDPEQFTPDAYTSPSPFQTKVVSHGDTSIVEAEKSTGGKFDL
jgi:hypothetical protein